MNVDLVDCNGDAVREFHKRVVAALAATSIALAVGVAHAQAGSAPPSAKAAEETNVIPVSKASREMREAAIKASEANSNLSKAAKMAPDISGVAERALERSAEPYLRRASEIADEASEIQYGRMPKIPSDLGMNQAIGQGLKGAAKGAWFIGTAADLYNISSDLNEAQAAANKGNFRLQDQKFGDAAATTFCLHPLASGACLASSLASNVVQVDVVKWALKTTAAETMHQARNGCVLFPDPLAFYDPAQNSDECTDNTLKEMRADRQAEMDRIASQNAAEALARDQAAYAAQAAVSTPVQPPPGPSNMTLFLDSLNQTMTSGLQQRQSKTSPQAPGGTCTPAKTLDPKTGCHPGHDEKSHPGGCKCAGAQ